MKISWQLNYNALSYCCRKSRIVKGIRRQLHKTDIDYHIYGEYFDVFYCPEGLKYLSTRIPLTCLSESNTKYKKKSDEMCRPQGKAKIGRAILEMSIIILGHSGFIFNNYLLADVNKKAEKKTKER